MLPKKYSRETYLEMINLENQKQKTALITGAAGFIGFHISKRLLDEGWRVIGVDCMNDYYAVSLKEHRENMLLQNSSYKSVHQRIEAPNVLMNVFSEERPNIVIHLAAQAGVRYSIENPRSYLEANINGTFELLEASRAYPPEHMLLASTSSAYGANTEMPYRETAKADRQVSFYAATKKSTENMAHSHAHLFELPITMFRFFTVYGPWGRPDMALFKFTKAILTGEPIDVYNNGKMKRDFTYIDDLVNSVLRLVHAVPSLCTINKSNMSPEEQEQAVAPYRVVNIGNSRPEELEDLIVAIENATGAKAIKNFMPMQPGDVQATWADTTLLTQLTGYSARTHLNSGVREFVKWYREYYET
jgi:UDP-glucuronate 4-epimerase